MSEKTWTCPNCRGSFEYTEHSIVDGMVGKKTPIHECGHQYVSAIFKPASKDAKAFWKRVQQWVEKGS